jgi:hypothetical protein
MRRCDASPPARRSGIAGAPYHAAEPGGSGCHRRRRRGILGQVQAESRDPVVEMVPTFCSANALYWLRTSALSTVPACAPSPPWRSSPRRRPARCSPDSTPPPASDPPRSPTRTAPASRSTPSRRPAAPPRCRTAPAHGEPVIAGLIQVCRPARWLPAHRVAAPRQAVIRARARRDVHARHPRRRRHRRTSNRLCQGASAITSRHYLRMPGGTPEHPYVDCILAT